ncbi:hypothetical protein PVK06_047313 [Gossypium arboreum]|uniref:Uncharacterized protein n=1 Tax=Gossypium arboreum TaxID=29729 RepID=A0ABR0MDI1_GOSAR|nr:hypothetical protein PVK06_047313 [Gossypium arboreum]
MRHLKNIMICPNIQTSLLMIRMRCLLVKPSGWTPPCTTNDHDENYGEIQLELVIENHRDELDIVETVSDLIDIVVELTINTEVKDELTTNMEPKLIMNESVEEPIHFLAIVEKVPTDEVEEFDSFPFKNGSKA